MGHREILLQLISLHYLYVLIWDSIYYFANHKHGQKTYSVILLGKTLNDRIKSIREESEVDQ